ncbi:TrkA family potassium uptake protein, partial [Acinetobacter baumannii]
VVQYILDPHLILKEGDILLVEGLLEPLRRLSKRFKNL